MFAEDMLSIIRAVSGSPEVYNQLTAPSQLNSRKVSQLNSRKAKHSNSDKSKRDMLPHSVGTERRFLLDRERVQRRSLESVTRYPLILSDKISVHAPDLLRILNDTILYKCILNRVVHRARASIGLGPSTISHAGCWPSEDASVQVPPTKA